MAIIAENTAINILEPKKRIDLIEDEPLDDYITVNYHYVDNKNQTKYNLIESGNTKIYLTARESIESQYYELKEYYNISLGRTHSISLKTLNKILNLNPLAVSYELTYEQSILFTFIFGDFTFFLQQNLTLENDDDDEVLLSVFKNDESLPNYAGSLEYIFNTIHSYFPLIYGT